MLELQRFFIREHAALFKTTDTYDIINPDTQQVIGTARENPGSLVAFLRLILSKKLMPTRVEVTSAEDNSLVFLLRRPVGFFREIVEVYDADNERVGFFKSKVFSFGGGFWVHDKEGRQIAEVKGDWVGWNFRFLTPDGDELGQVTKKWAGLGKELFTSADNYMVILDDDLADEPTAKMLLLAAALAIDIVYYEHQ